MGSGERLSRSGVAIASAAVVFGLCLVPVPASGQNALAIDEVKLGILAHDVGFAGGKEGGVDANGEVLLHSPIDDRTAALVEPWLRWLMQPRPHLGFEVNASGYTNQFYLGGTWTWVLLRPQLTSADALEFGISFGPSFNDGLIRAHQPDRKSLGSHVLFRESLELGYRFAPPYAVSLFFDHVSNGGLAKENQSINNAGMRFGIKF